MEASVKLEFVSQQLQLSHRPERKTADVQLHVDTLQREHKRFVAKLRAVDPRLQTRGADPSSVLQEEGRGAGSLELSSPYWM